MDLISMSNQKYNSLEDANKGLDKLKKILDIYNKLFDIKHSIINEDGKYMIVFSIKNKEEIVIKI